MNNQEYWENRAIIKDKLLEKDINKTEKKLLKLFWTLFFHLYANKVQHCIPLHLQTLDKIMINN